MTLIENKKYIDNKIWRWRSKKYHKINLIKDYIFEDIKIPLPIINFLIFICFIDNYSIENSYIETNNNSNLFGDVIVSKEEISNYLKF